MRDGRRGGDIDLVRRVGGVLGGTEESRAVGRGDDGLGEVGESIRASRGEQLGQKW